MDRVEVTPRAVDVEVNRSHRNGVCANHRFIADASQCATENAKVIGVFARLTLRRCLECASAGRWLRYRFLLNPLTHWKESYQGVNGWCYRLPCNCEREFVERIVVLWLRCYGTSRIVHESKCASS